MAYRKVKFNGLRQEAKEQKQLSNCDTTVQICHQILIREKDLDDDFMKINAISGSCVACYTLNSIISMYYCLLKRLVSLIWYQFTSQTMYLYVKIVNFEFYFV